MIRVEITFEHNDNEIRIVKIEHIVTGKPNIENTIRELTDKAKAEFIAALNA